jgi:UDP-3-O-[3-hydroxymyristoyl] glucosamine N-acyltransferase
MFIKLHHPISTGALAEALKLSWEGGDYEIKGVGPANETHPNMLCFTTSKMGYRQDLTVISDVLPDTNVRVSWIPSPRPRLDFIRALQWLEKEVGFERAPVDRITNYDLNRGIQIGRGTTIGSYVKIAQNVRIGKDCIIKSGAVIGEAGFGFERDEEGKPIRFPHLGNVVIGDRVEIGSGTTVCRGTLGSTIIEDDVKIDDHVHIAHNVRVKKKAMVVACAEVSGSVVIGEEAWIGPNASILEKLNIGRQAFIGIGAVVIRDVPDGVTVVGNPARQIERRKR